MLNYKPWHCLPGAEDLPDSDDTPVDNELQDLIPHLLKSILALIWSDRWDWFFGVDMGIYYDPEQLTNLVFSTLIYFYLISLCYLWHL